MFINEPGQLIYLPAVFYNGCGHTNIKVSGGDYLFKKMNFFSRSTVLKPTTPYQSDDVIQPHTIQRAHGIKAMAGDSSD